jgi:hypothetical protein
MGQHHQSGNSIGDDTRFLFTGVLETQAARPFILPAMSAKIGKHALIAVVSLVLGFIGGTIAAIATWPFWGWFEKNTGIESLGHSGPDDWVYYFMAGLAAVVIFAALEFLFRKRPAPGTPRRSA